MTDATPMDCKRCKGKDLSRGIAVTVGPVDLWARHDGPVSLVSAGQDLTLDQVEELAKTLRRFAWHRRTEEGS